MRRMAMVFTVLAVSTLAMAGSTAFIWGTVGLQDAEARTNAALSSMEGLMKAHPFGVAGNPGLCRVLEERTDDVTTSVLALEARLGTALVDLSPADRQGALDGFAAILVGVADLKQLASNRGLTDVESGLLSTYRMCAKTGFIWGATYGLVVPPLPAL